MKFKDAVAKLREEVTVEFWTFINSWEPVCTFNDCDVKSNGALPTTLPFILIVPVKVWVSSAVLPNIVEPLSNIIDAEVISVCTSCAVSLPVTTTLPFIVWFPMNVFDAVVALHWVAYNANFCASIFTVVLLCTIGKTTSPA